MVYSNSFAFKDAYSLAFILIGVNFVFFEDCGLLFFRFLLPFKGDIDDYRQWLQSKTNAGKMSSAATETRSDNRKDQRKKDAEVRQKLSPLRNKIKSIEKTMTEKQTLLTDLEEKLSDNSIYDDSNRDQLKIILQQQGETKSLLDDIELEWLELSDQLETLSAVD